MRKVLQDLLVCPRCGNPLSVKSVRKEEEKRIIEGELSCNCGMVYPIVKTIPRILPGAFGDSSKLTEKLKRKTQESFGYQWTKFSKMYCDFRENFLNYIKPIEPPFFKGKLGLDAGCGFGRHIFNAAAFGAEMVGIDVSAAIDSSFENTKHFKNVHLVQGDIYNIPFRKSCFDFVYSIGVLHHLPKPKLGFRALVRLVKPKGAIFIWVYSNQRKGLIRILELTRKITTKLPFSLVKVFCFFIALIDYYLLIICPLRLIRRNKHLDKLLFPRIRLYGQYPFQVNFADWFDRFSAPIRFYYNEEDVRNWFKQAGLVNIRISATGLYGWRAYGEKRG